MDPILLYYKMITLNIIISFYYILLIIRKVSNMLCFGGGEKFIPMWISKFNNFPIAKIVQVLFTGWCGNLNSKIKFKTVQLILSGILFIIKDVAASYKAVIPVTYISVSFFTYMYHKLPYNKPNWILFLKKWSIQILNTLE